MKACPQDCAGAVFVEELFGVPRTVVWGTFGDIRSTESGGARSEPTVTRKMGSFPCACIGAYWVLHVFLWGSISGGVVKPAPVSGAMT